MGIEIIREFEVLVIEMNLKSQILKRNFKVEMNRKFTVLKVEMNQKCNIKLKH